MPLHHHPARSGAFRRAFRSAPWIVATAGVVTSAAAVPSFVEHARFGTGATICVAFADSDGDGDPDLAVGNYFSQQNELHVNQGGLVFTPQDAFGLRSTFALVWGDVDNDGDPDAAVGNGQNGLNRLILNNGGNTFGGSAQFGANSTVAMAWADYDLDGDLDLAVGNGILGVAQQNYLYVNDGAGGWTEEAQFGVGQTCTLVWGDADGDGDADLAVGNGGFGFVEQNVLYLNNGDGTFTARAEFGLGDTSSMAWGDADGDGDLDLAVANWNAGQSALYVNDGAGNFTVQPQFGVGDPNTVAWGDFDNDGDLDLAQGNGDFGSAAPNSLWVNDGTAAFVAFGGLGLGSTDGVAWADVDLDGDLDLAAGNEHTPTTNYLYENLENDADALFLRLVGHRHDLGAGYSNRDAIGAKVTAYEAGFLGDPAHRLGFREICAHGGFSSQNAIEAHFGLPGRTTVDVRIVWPGSDGSRITQDLAGVPASGRFTVEEGITQTAAPGAVVAPGAHWSVVPNPSRGDVSLTLAGAVRGDDVDVIDAAGRVVRRLHGAAGDGLPLRARWDGRDAQGRPVGAGVYFVRQHGTPEAGRVVILR